MKDGHTQVARFWAAKSLSLLISPKAEGQERLRHHFFQLAISIVVQPTEFGAVSLVQRSHSQNFIQLD